MIRSPLGDECRRHFGSTPQPRLPDPVVVPTAEDPTTKAATDKAQALAKRQAEEGKSLSRTRLTAPPLGMPRTAALLGGGMGPA